ncbi:MAG: hypothetical protein HYY37_02765 [Candidatus Aenigmarchaeota archaeon]|nr:hypothetical protein [Candidatus Aenigmarchaeota archaeon]
MKAQTSMEIAAIASLVLIAFALAAGLAAAKSRDLETMRDAEDKKRACSAFAHEVNSVFAGGNGTVSLLQIAYGIQVVNDTANTTGVVCALCCNTTRNGQAAFTLPGGWVRIENRNGGIDVG